MRFASERSEASYIRYVPFKSYMSVAGDNPDLNKFIVSLRGRDA